MLNTRIVDDGQARPPFRDDERLTSVVSASIRQRILHQLAVRQKGVLTLPGRRVCDNQIAELRVISEKTVKVHIGRIQRKLAVSDRTAAYRLAGGLCVTEQSGGH